MIKVLKGLGIINGIRINLIPLLVFLIVFFVQLNSGQFLALVTIFLLGYLSVIKLLALKEKFLLGVESIIVTFFWTFLIVYMVRPSSIWDFDSFADLFWLLIGAVFLVLGSILSGISYVSIRNGILVSAGLGGWITLVGHLTNSTFFGLLNEAYAGTRLVGGFDGPNEAGAFYLIITVITTIAVLFNDIDKKLTCFVLIPAISIILLTLSRGAIGGLIAICILSLIIQIYKSKRRIITITIITLIVTVFYNFLVDIYIPYFNSIRYNAGDRNYLFDFSLNLFLQKPLFGGGIGYFKMASTIINQVPHNEFVYFFIAGGIVGGVSLTIMFIYVLLKTLKFKMYPEFCAVIIFMSQEMFFNHMIRGRVSILFWLVTVMMLVKQRDVITEQNGHQLSCYRNLKTSTPYFSTLRHKA